MRDDEVIASIGSSGFGKSPLLRSLNLLEVPDADSDGASICMEHNAAG